MDTNSLYWIVGALVIMNVGTIASVLVGVGKLIWWLSALNETVKKSKQDVDAAHAAIRDLKHEIRGI